jgi:hypothetical protein
MPNVISRISVYRRGVTQDRIMDSREVLEKPVVVFTSKARSNLIFWRFCYDQLILISKLALLFYVKISSVQCRYAMLVDVQGQLIIFVTSFAHIHDDMS